MAAGQPHQTPPRLVRKADTPAVTKRLLNLPNILTLCRLGSIPIFLLLLSKQRYTAALYVFVAAAVTDSLDGTVARWFDARTELGAFLDPFADKLMLVSAFVVMTIYGDFPAWLLIVVAIRDIVIVFGYLMLSFFTGERIPVRPSYLGQDQHVPSTRVRDRRALAIGSALSGLFLRAAVPDRRGHRDVGSPLHVPRPGMARIARARDVYLA